jgi:hypothetical protein
MPRLGQMSSTAVPPSACRRAYVTCSSVNRDFFIAIFSILKGVKSDLTLVLDRSTFFGGGGHFKVKMVTKRPNFLIFLYCKPIDSETNNYMNNQNLRVNEKSASEDEIDILDFFKTITENIKLLLVGPLACGLLVLGISFLVPQTYESSFTLGTNSMNADTGQIQRLVLRTQLFEDVAEKNKVGNGSPLTGKDILKKTTSVIRPNSEIEFKVQAPKAQEAYFLATALLDAAFKYKDELLSKEVALLNNYYESLASVSKVQNRLEKELLLKSVPDALLAQSYLGLISQSTIIKELTGKQRMVVEGLSQINALNKPTLQPKAVIPNKPLLFGLGVLISGFFLVLYIFIRKAFIVNNSFSGS